jgi:T5SS/PEP-CTERM-associated repeat protein
VASYTWIGGLTGDWDDPSNWENVTTGQDDDGYPGAGDTASTLTAGTVTVNSDTAANLDAYAADIVGDITVTNEIFQGTFSGGNVSAGTVEGSEFEGVSLTANTIDGAYLDAGTVTATVLVDATVDGATVTAQSIERDPSGQYAYPSQCEVDSGSLTGDSMTLVGPSAAIDGSDFFDVLGGTATVTGAATATGADVYIKSGGGTLQFSDGLTLSDGATLYLYNGGVTTAETLTADGTISIDEAGSTLTVAETLTLGSSGDGALTLTDGGALIVDGAFDMAENGGSTSTATVGNTIAGEQESGALTIQGEWQIGVAGTATAIINQGVTDEALGGITLGAQATGDGTLTVSQADTVFSVTGPLVIGEAGAGTLNVQDGAVLDAATSVVTVGVDDTATGAATITGAGSQFETGSLTVGGSSSKATVKVSSGGDLEIASNLTLGAVADSKGVLTVTDAGSQVSVGGDATLGDGGVGTLSMTGGALSVSGAMTLGEVEGSSGKLVLSDSAVVGVGGDLTIGVAASGTVTLGSTTAASSVQLVWGDLLTVGEDTEGTLTINAGDSVSALADGAGQLAIGADAGSSGTVSLAGAGASLDGAALSVGGTASAQGGDGSLSIRDGGSATFDDATIWSTGEVTDAGALSISGPLSGSGSVKISGAGQFTIGGSDSTVGIDFVSGGSNEVLDLTAAHLPSVKIKGFGADDTIDVSGLSTSDTIGVSSKGAATTVRFLQAGKTVGSLHFAMKAGQGEFNFDAADGALTFAPEAANETALSASIQEQIFNSAPLSDSSAYHGLEAIGGRGSAGAGVTPDLWSVGHAPGGL